MKRKLPDDGEFIDFARGHTIPEIAGRYSVTQGTARAKCSRLKVRAKPIRARIGRKAYEELAPSHTAREFAAMYGTSVKTVRIAARRYGVSFVRERGGSRHADRNEMIAYLAGAFSLYSIGRLFGLSESAICKIVKAVRAGRKEGEE